MALRWTRQSIAATAIGFGLVSACSAHAQPTTAQLQTALTEQMGGATAFLRITTFSVEAIENLGNKVEPRWYARFRATAKFTSPTYVHEASIDGTTIVRTHRRLGDSITVFGKTMSTLYAGEYRTSVQLDGSPFAPSLTGLPLNGFGQRRVIVSGTPEEATFRADLAARLEAQRRLRIDATTATREVGQCRTIVGGQSGALFLSDVGFRATTPWPAIKPDVSFASVTSITRDTWGGMPTLVFELTEKIPNSGAPGSNWTAFFPDHSERDRCSEIATQAYDAWKAKFPSLVGVGRRGLASR